MRVRICVAMLAGLLGLMLVTGFAQEKKTYTKGETVKVRYVGEMVAGKVVAAKISGFIDVEFDWKGKKIVKTFPLTLVEAGPAVAAPVVATPAPVSKPATGNSKLAAGSKSPAVTKPAATPTTPGKTPAPGNEQDLRIWTSESGTFQVEARFVGLENEKVTLMKKDGTTVSVSLDKLSVADRELANQLASTENPFMESPENTPADDPFQEVQPAGPENSVASIAPNGTTPTKPSGPLKSSDLEIDVLPVNWSEVDKISSALVPTHNFKLVPDVGVEPKLDILDKPYVFGGRSGIRSGKSVPVKRFDKIQSVFIDPISNQAIVPLFYSWSDEPKVLRVVRVNLKDGKTTQKIFPSPVMLASFHPATQRFMGHGDRNLAHRGADANGFGVWTQSTKGFDSQGAWKLDSQELKVNGVPESAQFAGTDYAVVWTANASVSVWSLVDKKPLYVVETGWHAGPPAISANGKYLGVLGKTDRGVDGQVLILELATGEIIGALPQKNMTSIAFHPEGRYLAAASAQRVVVYDLQEGVTYRDIFMNKAIQSSVWRKELVWLGDNFLLSGNEHLIDIEHSTVLWHYEFPGRIGQLPACAFYGGQYWYAIQSDDGEEAGLFHIDLPHKEALTASAAIDPNDLILKPATRIRLEVTAGATPDEQARIKASLSREITEKAMFLDESSSLVLTAATSTGKTSTETYRFFGGRYPDQQVTTTAQIASLRLTQGGQTLWENQSVTGGAVPMFIHLQPGETAQEHVNAMSKPNMQFFYDVEIPSRLANVPAAGAYGFSKVTKNGVEEAAPPDQKPQ